jgi:hypothetical protein
LLGDDEILKDGGYTANAAAPIVEDLCIQATSFSKVEFSLCPREANYVTHLLTKEVDPQPNVWFEEPPGLIVSILIDDVSVIFLSFLLQ